jgi:integrase/recombinase XerD
MDIKANIIKHKNESRIAVQFPINNELNQRFKMIDGARWSRTLKVWHLPDNLENRIKFHIPQTEQKTINTNNKIIPSQPIDVQLAEHITKFKRWLFSKRYSPNTIKTYSEALAVFLNYYKEKSVNDITNNDIIAFNNDYIIAKKLSSTYQNQMVNAIKLFYSKIQDTKIDVQLIHRPKIAKVLPNVLSKEEVKELLEKPTNLKHKAMLCLIYSCGLRSGELLNLKMEDVDSKRNLLLIKLGKGMKDRIVPLSPRILDILREYYKAYMPQKYLFEGQIKGERYDERSLQKVLKFSLAKTKIKKPVTLHWLRHSFATHLLEGGTDLRYIQEILGHSSSRTTEIYTHVSTKSIQKIISPFDTL